MSSFLLFFFSSAVSCHQSGLFLTYILDFNEMCQTESQEETESILRIIWGNFNYKEIFYTYLYEVTLWIVCHPTARDTRKETVTITIQKEIPKEQATLRGPGAFQLVTRSISRIYSIWKAERNRLQKRTTESQGPVWQ